MHCSVKKKEQVMKNERVVMITEGPDRFGIAWALMHGENRLQLPIVFKVAEQNNDPFLVSHWVEVIKVNSVEREDGSGHRFNITGINTANRCKVNIFFDLHNRKGTMTFVK